MSAKPVPLISCRGKRAYDTFSVAAKMAQRTTRGTGDAMQPYHCRHCDRFHIGDAGHKPRRSLRTIGVEDA